MGFGGKGRCCVVRRIKEGTGVMGKKRRWVQKPDQGTAAVSSWEVGREREREPRGG